MQKLEAADLDISEKRPSVLPKVVIFLIPDYRFWKKLRSRQFFHHFFAKLPNLVKVFNAMTRLTRRKCGFCRWSSSFCFLFPWLLVFSSSSPSPLSPPSASFTTDSGFFFHSDVLSESTRSTSPATLTVSSTTSTTSSVVEILKILRPLKLVLTQVAQVFHPKTLTISSRGPAGRKLSSKMGKRPGFLWHSDQFGDGEKQK